MADYRVQAEALHKNARRLDTVGDEWDELERKLNGMELSRDAFGILGTWAGVPTVYEQVLQHFTDIVVQGGKTVHGAARTLHAVATHYEWTDEQIAGTFP